MPDTANRPAPPAIDLPPDIGAGWPAWKKWLLGVAGAVLTAALSSLVTWECKPDRERVREVRTPADHAHPHPVVDLGPPIDYEGVSFEAPEPEPLVLPLAGPLPARWPTDRITYGIDYASARSLIPPLSDDAVRGAVKVAAQMWSDGLQVEFAEVPFGSALIPIRFERLDGPGNTLAQAYLADGTSRPKPLTVDSGDRWTAGGPAPNLVSLPVVLAHEFGHSLGRGHAPAGSGQLMQPTYSSVVTRPTAADYAAMVQLGYRPRTTAPTAPEVLSFPVQAKTTDVADALRKAGFTVTKN